MKNLNQGLKMPAFIQSHENQYMVLKLDIM